MIILAFISERLKISGGKGIAYLLRWFIVFVGIWASGQIIAGNTVNAQITKLVEVDAPDEIISFKKDNYLHQFPISRFVGALFLAVSAAYFIAYILKSYLHGSRNNSNIDNIVIKNSRRISQKLTVVIVEINKNEYHVFQTGSDLEVFPSQSSEKDIVDRLDDAT